MTNNTKNTQFAKKYASALFEDAVELHLEEEIKEELVVLTKAYKHSLKLKGLISSRFIHEHNEDELFGEISEHLEISDLLRNFFCVLIKDSCLSIFPLIEPLYTHLFNEHQGIVSIKVVTAQALTEDLKSHLLHVLEGIFHKQIFLDLRVDDSLIAGLTVQAGSIFVDASIKSKLEKLNFALRGSQL